jgi:hypothetical protein
MTRKEILCPHCDHQPFRNETGLAWHIEHQHWSMTQEREKGKRQSLPEVSANQAPGTFQKVQEELRPATMADFERLLKGEAEHKEDFVEGKTPVLATNQVWQSESTPINLAFPENNVSCDDNERIFEDELIDSKLFEECIAQPDETEVKLTDYENRFADLTADNARLEEELVAAKEALFSPEHRQAVLNEAANNLTYYNWLELGRRLGFYIPREEEESEKSELKSKRVGIKVGNTIFYSQ